ncbi:polyprenyl synthetase [Streptomyces sp. RFCAC02]|uniref:polyprenyl synthetase n=1 Tax=Streptomyces sp. RFCAC02 TaxID=2499143 RepID=UPI00102207E2|nr:polyprenyl synthetase [Streptomyces sp. RFCAC02]
METGDDRGGAPAEQAVLLLAGMADLAVGAVTSAVGTLRGFLGRADTAGLAADARHDLTARGRLALDRWATVPPAHLEILARRAAARADD